MLIKATRPPFVQRARMAYILCAATFALLPARAVADVLRDCEQLENAPLAIRACSRLISDIPGSAALHKTRGLAYFRNGETDRAIEDYSEALRLDPKATETYYSRGRALLDKNAYTQAIQDFNQALVRNSKHSLARNGRAWALFKLGDLTAALEEADQTIAADSKYAPAYDTRAHIYEALGKREQAVADFRKALALDPHDPLVHITREGLRRLGAAP
jgi:tetratricopeptide (TPR) repeat protein